MKKHSVKKILIVGAAYLICFATLLATLLFSPSTGLYRSEMEAYVQFDIGSFKGIIYYLRPEENAAGNGESGEPGVGEAGGGNQGNNQGSGANGIVPVKHEFGSNGELHISGCVPGMQPQAYPFIVANGSDEGNFAGADIVCTIKIRTMNNIPLRYQLQYNGKTYVSCDKPEEIVKKDTNSKTQDALWYEYTFYDEENGGEDTLQEAVFDLKGGTLSADQFKLLIDWPIITTEDDTTLEIETNNIKYMKEVEILEVLATLSSKNNTGENENPSGGRSTYGVIFLDPSHSTDQNGVLTQKYVGDYRALTHFEVTNDEGGESGGTSEDGYAYYFKVNNGNNIYKNGTLTTSQTTNYMHYTVKLVTPYDSKTRHITFTLSQVNDPETPVNYAVLKTEYRKYDVLYDSPTYGQFTVLTQEEANAFLTEQESATSADALQYEIYRMDSFCLDAEPTDASPEAVHSLCNAMPDKEGYNNYAENIYCLSVTDTADAETAMATLLADSHNHEGIPKYKNRVDYKFELWFSAIGSDLANTPDVPVTVPDAYAAPAAPGGLGES